MGKIAKNQFLRSQEGGNLKKIECDGIDLSLKIPPFSLKNARKLGFGAILTKKAWKKTS